ncbi:MAG: hypothetical protein AAF840_06450 [Bacteroidota bacterium]
MKHNMVPNSNGTDIRNMDQATQQLLGAFILGKYYGAIKEFVFMIVLFFAWLPLLVFHVNFGRRVFSKVWIFIGYPTFVMLLGYLFSVFAGLPLIGRQVDMTGLLWLRRLVLIAGLFHLIWMWLRIHVWKEVWYSRSYGDSWMYPLYTRLAERITIKGVKPLTILASNHSAFQRRVEPLVPLTIGYLIEQYISEPVGAVIMFTSVCMWVVAYMIHQNLLNMQLDLSDSLLVSQEVNRVKQGAPSSNGATSKQGMVHTAEMTAFVTQQRASVPDTPLDDELERLRTQQQL